MPLSVGDRLGPYEILALIGKGGMGEVYRANDTKLKRDVAVKVLPDAFSRDPERMARFQREAEVLASLNHPNIAHIYGVEDRALIMELVDGDSPRGPMPFDDVWRIASQIATALEYAHDKGVVHRDLKPANVKVTHDGVVKLLDFGLAKAFSEPGSTPSADAANSPTLTMGATQLGVILGTAAYMAPEQAKGKVVDKRADIWAFGVVLYELLTGRQLFQGEDVSDTLAHVLTRQPEWEQVPQRARWLLRECLEKDPKQRLRDIGDAKRLVTEAAADYAPSASRLSHVTRNVAWIVAALSIALAAGVSFLHFREALPAAPEVVRLSIPIPEKGNAGSFPNLSVSPDGRRVVFRVYGGLDNRMWIHSLDSLDSRPLAGTEEMNGAPFWSPDSRWVVFSAQGKLKKIEASGGPPQTLCDIPGNLRGGFWTHDNRVVFGTASGGLLQVASGGGAASPVTTAESGTHGAPSLLSDGRHFVYLRSGSGERNGIYLGSLDAKPDTQDSKRLLADVSQPAYAPDAVGGNGHILFVREGTLMAQPFDTARLEFAGDAVPVAEQVPAQDAGRYSVSSTGVLVYASGGGASGRQLTWYDRQGKPGDTVWTSGPYNELTLAPDASRMAVVRAGNPAETWIFEFVRGASTRLTPSGGTQPAWSPDGSRVVYRHAQQGEIGLYLKAASGAGNEDVLLKGSHVVQPKDWSRDGRFLLYEDQDPKTKWDLWALPVTASGTAEGKPAAFLHSEFNETDGKFSPDGRFVAYVSDESGKPEVYVSPFPDPKGGKVTISNGGGYQPRWRRDGKELLYFTGDGKLMSVDVTLSPAFKAGAPRVLFPAGIYGGGTTMNQVRWDMTADGKKFLINTIAGETSAPFTVVLNWQAALRK